MLPSGCASHQMQLQLRLPFLTKVDLGSIITDTASLASALAPSQCPLLRSVRLTSISFFYHKEGQSQLGSFRQPDAEQYAMLAASSLNLNVPSCTSFEMKDIVISDVQLYAPLLTLLTLIKCRPVSDKPFLTLLPDSEPPVAACCAAATATAAATTAASGSGPLAEAVIPVSAAPSGAAATAASSPIVGAAGMVKRVMIKCSEGMEWWYSTANCSAWLADPRTKGIQEFMPSEDWDSDSSFDSSKEYQGIEIEDDEEEEEAEEETLFCDRCDTYVPRPKDRDEWGSDGWLRCRHCGFNPESEDPEAERDSNNSSWPGVEEGEGEDGFADDESGVGSKSSSGAFKDALGGLKEEVFAFLDSIECTQPPSEPGDWDSQSHGSSKSLGDALDALQEEVCARFEHALSVRHELPDPQHGGSDSRSESSSESLGDALDALEEKLDAFLDSVA